MEFDDIEFKEGIHKSVRRGPLRKVEAEDEAAPVPIREAVAESEITPIPAAPERGRGRYGRWFQIVAAVLLICIVGGGLLVFQALHAPQKAHTAQAASNHGTLCSMPGAPVDLGKGNPALNSVAALSTNDVWTVGSLADQTLVEHWNGKSWHVVPSPGGQSGDERIQSGSELTGIAAVSANNVWAVGTIALQQYYGPTFGAGLHTLIEHWDGSRWSTIPSPDGAQFQVVSITQAAGTLLQGRNQLNGISPLSANDIWAVGSADSSNYFSYNAFDPANTFPLVEHWDGSHWSIMPASGLPAHTTLNGVTAIAPDNVWAVGVITQQGEQSPLIAHWDGHQWSVVQGAANVNGGNLVNISASGANNIWAAGFGVLEHWDGTSWSQVTSTLPPTNGTYDIFSSVLALSANDVWLAGEQNSSANTGNTNLNSAVIAHWDGQKWKNVPQSHAVTGSLDAIASADGQIWGVGTSVVGLQQIQNPLIETNC